MNSFISAIVCLLMFVAGGFGVFVFDRRPADFPAIHEHFLFYHFDWTAPESIQVASYDSGYVAGDAARKKSDFTMLDVYQKAILIQNKSVDDAHAKELEAEKKLLKAHNEAITARQKEVWTLAGIDKMQTTGSSCQRAEQIIRGVIR